VVSYKYNNQKGNNKAYRIEKEVKICVNEIMCLFLPLEYKK
jgi:hypothetical protein